MNGKLTVTPLGWTFVNEEAMVDATDGRWEPDADARGGELLAEFAGRACYQSWSKPNPATATNAGYLRHILDVGHYSVLEHGTATFYLTGVSRSFTHELVRHRHLSYSQLSQRFVASGDTAMVEPDIIAGDAEAHLWFESAVGAARTAYDHIVRRLERLHADAPAGTALRKAIRQAARAVLPNATETRIVVTGNYRAWRHFINLRATEAADVEIRAVAVEILRHLQQIAPNVFGDYQITTLADGTEVAASPLTKGTS